MIEINEALTLLSKTYPGFRDEFVGNAQSWIGDNGEFLHYVLITSLSTLVVRNIDEGNYENIDELFSLVESIMINGTEEASNLISVGFLESLQNQTDVDPKYWAPLLGPEAVEFCKTRDDFYGIKS
jgi:hypothetical protein